MVKHSDAKALRRRSSRQLAANIAVALLASASLGSSLAIAKGGTARPPGTPPPPADVAPAPTPLTRTSPATVQFLTPPSPGADALNHGFDITGFVQSYDAAAACPGGGSGGKVQLTGLSITIPCNLIIQMPANTITWKDFVTGLSTQTAPSPTPANLAYDLATTVKTSWNPSFELHLIGNIVGGQYIAALGYGSQQSVHSGSGVITTIRYTDGHLIVNTANNTVVELEINDPKGRFTRGGTNGGTIRDDRLSVDDQNPTIVSATGYPMCVPRSTTTNGDPLCPQKNRPLASAGCRDFVNGVGITPATGGAGVFFNGGANGFGGKYCTSFVMKAPPGTTPDPVTKYPPASAIAKVTEPDATQQAPFEIGDFITWSGTLLRGVLGNAGRSLYSVHTITANVGIFTQPGTLPAYVHLGEFGVAGDTTPAGVAATSIAGIPQEVQNRLVVEADVTDITAIADVYLVDQDTQGFELQRWVTPASMTGRAGDGTDVDKGTPVGYQGGDLVPGTGVAFPKPAGFTHEGGIVTQFDGAQISRARIRASKATPGLLQSPSRTIRMVLRTLCDPANINPTTNVAFSGVPSGVTSPVASGGLGWTAINTASTGVPGVTSDGTTCIGRAIAANGLLTGQYQAPVFEFIFPENVGRGDPIVSNNFWDLNFLAGDATAPGPLVPQPW